MKRDWELCRTILRLTEELPDDKARVDVFESSELEGYSRSLIGYHVYLLDDVGLLEARDVRDRDNRWDLYPLYLTMAGHDFLEATRNESVWNKTLAAVTSKGGSATLEIVKELALTYLRSEFGI